MPRFPKASPRVQGLSDRVFGQLVPPAGVSVAPLNVGDTYLEPIAVARAEAQLSAEHPRLHNYAPVQGEPALLDAIQAKLQRRHGMAPDRHNLQVMSGATSGLGVVCTALLSPGDEVVLPAPYWPLIRGIVSYCGGVPVEVPMDAATHPSDGAALRALEAAITPRTVAMYINSPQNPTGQIQSDELQAGILTLAQRHDLWLVTDEVYEDLYYGDQPPRSLWTRPGAAERTIANHSMSKAYGLAGARVGFTHGPAAAMAAVRGVQTFFTYCAPRPLQLGAARALQQGDGWLAMARQQYGEAARMTAEALAEPVVQGGTFHFFDARPYLRPGEDMLGLLQRVLDAGVMLTPGSASGAAYAHWARVCFTSVPLDELAAALVRLKTALTT